MRKQQEEFNLEIPELLRKIGLHGHLKGFSLIVRAIELLNEEDYHNRITSHLYPEIGEEFDCDPRAVERSIRHCITNLFKRKRRPALDNIFNEEDIKNGKVQNNLFLHSIKGAVDIEIYNRNKEDRNILLKLEELEKKYRKLHLEHSKLKNKYDVILNQIGKKD